MQPICLTPAFASRVSQIPPLGDPARDMIIDTFCQVTLHAWLACPVTCLFYHDHLQSPASEWPVVVCSVSGQCAGTCRRAVGKMATIGAPSSFLRPCISHAHSYLPVRICCQPPPPAGPDHPVSVQVFSAAFCIHVHACDTVIGWHFLAVSQVHMSLGGVV